MQDKHRKFSLWIQINTGCGTFTAWKWSLRVWEIHSLTPFSEHRCPFVIGSLTTIKSNSEVLFDIYKNKQLLVSVPFIFLILSKWVAVRRAVYAEYEGYGTVKLRWDFWGCVWHKVELRYEPWDPFFKHRAPSADSKEGVYRGPLPILWDKIK